MKIKNAAIVQTTDAVNLESTQPGNNADYAALKKMIRERGLLDKQPDFMARKILVNSVLFGANIAILLAVDNIWIQAINAVFMAFVLTQIGFIAHDTGHRQAFQNARKNDLYGLIHANLMVGMSYGWWLKKHNLHHAYPNLHDVDPDIDIPVIAFSEEDALKKRGVAKFIVKYQSILFFPLLLFESISLRVGSIEFLMKSKDWKYRAAEVILLILHFTWYFGVIFYALSGWHAILFIVIHQALHGFYLASVFAPNHKGMLILPKDTNVGFLRLQVLTARNVKAHPVTDFWYGGLNYQIEHHLFPSMARNKLREAQIVIRQFCEERGVSYYETSMFRSYVEILQFLHLVSAPLRLKEKSQN